MAIQDFINQLEECRKNNCPDCEKCIWSGEALANMPTKLKKIKLEQEPLEYDYYGGDHPLLKGFVEKFKGEIL